MNPKQFFLIGIIICLWSWCKDFDTHFRANSKESKLGPSFIIIKDPTRYIASCWSHYLKNHIGQFWNDVICEQPLRELGAVNDEWWTKFTFFGIGPRMSVKIITSWCFSKWNHKRIIIPVKKRCFAYTLPFQLCNFKIIIRVRCHSLIMSSRMRTYMVS